MRVGSLFSGIGGIDLGLEWAGMSVEWMVEKEAFCQDQLRKHWPNTPIYEDIKEIDWTTMPPVDVLAGGFPCQPFSAAGKRQGAKDDRHLWPFYLEAIKILRPTWIIAENVDGLRSMVLERISLGVEGRTITRSEDQDYYEATYIQQENMLLDDICGEIEDEDYQVQPIIVPACAKNAPHIRRRIFILAHTDSPREPCSPSRWIESRYWPVHGSESCLDDSHDGHQPQNEELLSGWDSSCQASTGCHHDMAHTNGCCSGQGGPGQSGREVSDLESAVADTSVERFQIGRGTSLADSGKEESQSERLRDVHRGTQVPPRPQRHLADPNRVSSYTGGHGSVDDGRERSESPELCGGRCDCRDMENTSGDGCLRSVQEAGQEVERTQELGSSGESGGSGCSLGNPCPSRLQGCEQHCTCDRERIRRPSHGPTPEPGHTFDPWAEADIIVCHDQKARRMPPAGSGICLLAHGVPQRVAKLKALGNSVSPILPYEIGLAMMEAQYGSRLQ